MSNCLVEEQCLKDIANAIRYKNGTENKYLPSQMGNAIEDIPTGKPTQTKSATPTTSQQIIEPDEGYELSSVTVNGVTSSIDNNIQAENIKNGIEILGVTGNYTGGGDKITITNGICLGSSLFSQVPSNLDISKATELNRLFYNCNNLASANLDIPNVTNCKEMFYYCSNMTSVTLTNSSSVKNMGGLFYNCTKLTSINLSDTSSVTDMSDMFNGCNSLTSIPNISTLNLQKSGNMFRNCRNLTDTTNLLSWTSTKITDMSSMFYSCSKMTSISLFDTSNATQMKWVFYDCSSLVDVPLFNTTKVIDLNGIFVNCNSLSQQSIDNILQMCMNVSSSYTAQKTLNYLGVRNATLIGYAENSIYYQDFLDAGWKIS